jgi:predicted phosphoribosyltransferase
MTMFADREQAARRLAERLAHYGLSRPLVLAIPRGAVPMGKIVADTLGGELDVVLVRKLGAPGNPEYAIGAVSEGGEVLVEPQAEELGIPPAYVEAEARRQLALLAARRARYTPARPPADPYGRDVVVLDDGVATGATFKSALAVVRARQPRRLIAAFAVAPAQTVRELATLADDVVCLATPEPFYAVGMHYVDFRQVDDDEVIATLNASTPATAVSSG